MAFVTCKHLTSEHRNIWLYLIQTLLSVSYVSIIVWLPCFELGVLDSPALDRPLGHGLE